MIDPTKQTADQVKNGDPSFYNPDTESPQKLPQERRADAGVGPDPAKAKTAGCGCGPQADDETVDLDEAQYDSRKN